jgi:hypothetical protein
MGRWTLIILLSLAGCTSENPVPGEPCDAAETCGPAGDAACVDGYCHIYDENSGYGKAIVALSFHRDLYDIAASVNIYTLYYIMPDGSLLDCSRILSKEIDPSSITVNPLVMNPRNLRLHWQSGGTFFPDNLIQFIRPAESIVFAVEAYEDILGEGDITALGCYDGKEVEGEWVPISISMDQTVEFVIQLNAP